MEQAVQKKLDAFFMQGSPLSFRKGDILIRAGEPIHMVYYLKKGHVRQFINTADGQDLTLHLFRPISYLPTMLLLSTSENKYNFEVIDEVVVWPKRADQVIRFLKENPDVLFDLATRLSLGIVGLLEKIENATYTNAYHKILSLLLYLANHYAFSAKDTTMLSLKLTHTDIASWTGMQRETASRQLEKLKKEGIITFEKSQCLVDKQKLKRELDSLAKNAP
ncbi:MAG: Crp/Fnr family transcriptional regulator [bacterium]|nr:Crp/Fnr family transcriptional regulator [bacterium]